MTRIEISDRRVKKKVKTKVENELIWWDPKHKVSHTFTGGRLNPWNMVWDHKLGKLIPEVENVYGDVLVEMVDEGSAEKWAKSWDYYHDNVESIIRTGGGVEIQVPDEVSDDVTEDLERQGFKYEVG